MTAVLIAGIILGVVLIRSCCDWRDPAVGAAVLLGGFCLLVMSGTALSVQVLHPEFAPRNGIS